jgi:hypothetical protein
MSLPWLQRIFWGDYSSRVSFLTQSRWWKCYKMFPELSNLACGFSLTLRIFTATFAYSQWDFQFAKNFTWNIYYKFPQTEMRNPCVSINDVNILFPIPGKGSDFSLRLHAQTGCGAQSASYPVHTGNSFHKRSQCLAGHSCPSSADINYAWTYISTPPLNLRGMMWN